MFKHSIKVPSLYKLAAKVAKQVKEDGASLKDLIYKLNHRNIKGLYALIATLLKKSNTLDYIIRSTQILIKENRLDPWLARVLITELLWGKKRLPNDNKPCQTVINYSKEMTDCLATFTDDAPTNEPSKVKKPRYVRVNTLKLSMAEAIDIFRDEGWILLRCGDNSDYGSFLATVASLSHDQFIVDMHVKDLLVFPPNTQFYKHHLYLNGDIVLQDKASCLAPLILSPEPKSSVLDMCSAPGMKASQLACITGKEGTVYAVERDQRRYQTLVKLTEGMGAVNVKCINKDVLTITAREFPDVEYILVDPSCSGSGMLDRPDYEDPDSKCNKSRLQSLAGFQITILRHALNNFPKAKRVLYSTCSLYSEENESVIEQVITTVKDFKLVDLKANMKSKWFNFGSSDFGAIGERCLYAKPEQDYTNGFFVALFERLNSDEEKNEFFVRRVKRSSECDTDQKQQNKENDNPVEEKQKIEENIPKESKKKKKSKHENEENISHDNEINVEKNTFNPVEEKQKIDENIPKETKKKKKSKHENKENISHDNDINVEENTFEESSKKKKKKSKHNEKEELPLVDEEKPKKKKSKINETTDIVKQKKKKKSKADPQNDESKNDESSFNVDETISEEVKPKKKKKSKNNETPEITQDISEKTKQKKKKKSKSSNEEYNNDEVNTENKKRKKKHSLSENEEIKSKKKKKSKHAE